MARTDVAMRMWLNIVGAAKRDGHDAVSHRHGKVVDLLSRDENTESSEDIDLLRVVESMEPSQLFCAMRVLSRKYFGCSSTVML